jgi:hypothetical protein
MGVGRTQIMNIIKRKSEILDDFKNNMPGSRKRQRRATGNEDINQLCWDWFNYGKIVMVGIYVIVDEVISK